MVDNTEQIKTMLSFDDDDFYFIQILKRRKDNPSLEKNSVVVKNFYIDSFENYEKLIPQIIDICNTENARAYIRLNKRNYKHLGMKMIKRVADYISSNNYKSLRNAFDAVVGEFHCDKDKTWVVDVDGYDASGQSFYELIDFIAGLQKNPMVKTIQTKTGVHLITRPFNKAVFKQNYPHIEIKTDNPTILFCP